MEDWPALSFPLQPFHMWISTFRGCHTFSMVAFPWDCTHCISRFAVCGRRCLFSQRIESAVSSPPEMKKRQFRAISWRIFQYGSQSLSCRAPIQFYRHEIPQESLQTAKRGVTPLSCGTAHHWLLVSLANFSDFKEICFLEEVWLPQLHAHQHDMVIEAPTSYRESKPQTKLPWKWFQEPRDCRI